MSRYGESMASPANRKRQYTAILLSQENTMRIVRKIYWTHFHCTGECRGVGYPEADPKQEAVSKQHKPKRLVDGKVGDGNSTAVVLFTHDNRKKKAMETNIMSIQDFNTIFKKGLKE